MNIDIEVRGSVLYASSEVQGTIGMVLIPDTEDVVVLSEELRVLTEGSELGDILKDKYSTFDEVAEEIVALRELDDAITDEWDIINGL